MKKRYLANVTAAVAVSAACAVDAQVSLHDESIDGDLSGLIASPNTFPIGQPGMYTVSGTVVDSDEDDVFAPGGAAGDHDVFTLSLAPGLQIESIGLGHFVGSGRAFLAVQKGGLMSVNTATDGGDFPAVAAGFTLVGVLDVGLNLLENDRLTGGFAGFSPGDPLDAPVPAGDYAFAIQNTETDLNTYTLSDTVAPVPEPASALLLVLAGGGLMCRPRR